MASNGSAVLIRIEGKIREIGRIIQNEEYQNALDAIEPVRRNLQRIREQVAPDCWQTLNGCLQNLVQLCEESLNGNIGQYNARYQASRVYNGTRGRPKINITREQLELLITEKYTAKKMAQHFNCSIQLIYKKCYSFGLHFRDNFFNGSDDALRQEISLLHSDFPNSGCQMMIGYLKARGIQAQRAKVRKLLAEIDPVGTAYRWSTGIKRRIYHVPCPNSLWHIDAHLKLIRWNFAIHGCIDGYSRLILYVQCKSNMTASAVIPLFANAAVEYGLPSRVRSDFGYENLFVAMMMNMLRGLNRASHIPGRSVHNQRIERLWVDVHIQVVDYFRKEFYELEQDGSLDINNRQHMFALHRVYEKSINHKLELFRSAWNSHTIRTAGRQTPKQLWLSGMLNNINSQHSASREVFHQPEDLYVRIQNSFGFDEYEQYILNQNEERDSNLNIHLDLELNELNQIEELLTSNLSDKVKYLQIITYLSGRS